MDRRSLCSSGNVTAEDQPDARRPLRSSVVMPNDRLRRKFASRISPDTRIEAAFAIKGVKGPRTASASSVLARYIERYGLTSTLGSHRLLGAQWLVVTEHRMLLFEKRGSGVLTRIGKLEHELHRTSVELQWADFTEATLHKRLIHLTTSDHRMNISQTIVSNDEPDLFVQAVGDRGREIGLQEL